MKTSYDRMLPLSRLSFANLWACQLIALFLIGIAALSTLSCGANKVDAITQEELVRRTQILFDSATSGDQKPWKEYFAADTMYFDEKGRNMDKAALLDDVTPLPSGYSGVLKLVNPQSRIVGDTAILAYDLDETEVIFGQPLKARYHETDTWMRRNGEWQIIAGQVLRYYEDPAPGLPDLAKYRDYVGVYELTKGIDLTVSMDKGHLYAQRGDKPKVELIAEAGDIFFEKGVEGRQVFRRAQNGKIDAYLQRRNNEDVVWRRLK